MLCGRNIFLPLNLPYGLIVSNSLANKNIVAYTANSTKPMNRKLCKYVLDERRVSVRVLLNMWWVVVVGEQVDMQFYCRKRLTAKWSTWSQNVWAHNPLMVPPLSTVPPRYHQKIPPFHIYHCLSSAWFGLYGWAQYPSIVTDLFISGHNLRT